MSTSDISIRGALDAHLALQPFLSAHGGVFAKNLMVDTQDLSQAQLEDLLSWFKDHGGRIEFSVDFRKEGRAKYNTHRSTCWRAVAENVRIYLRSETEEIRKRRDKPLSGFDRLVVNWASGIFAECDRKKREAMVARGRTCFYEDGSLLKRAIEVLGEPVPEAKK